MTARLLGEAIDGAEAKTGAQPYILGREEGLQNARLDLGWDAGTVIRDRQQDIVAGQNIVVFGCIILVEACNRRFNRQLAAIRHSVPRIDA